MSLVFFWNATIYLLVRNTRLRPLSTVLGFLLPLVIPALLLLALNLYSSDSTSSRLVNTSRLSTVLGILKAAPGWWEWVLRTSSPIFTILEGISTLLCIQAVSRFSLRRIEKSRAPDVLQLVFLVAAAGIYVVSAYFLWEVSSSRCEKGRPKLILIFRSLTTRYPTGSALLSSESPSPASSS